MQASPSAHPLLPILAVGGLSLAAAFDLEARHNNSKEMLADLHDLQDALAAATPNASSPASCCKRNPGSLARRRIGFRDGRLPG